MFEYLNKEVEEYNKIYENIHQAGELCYIDVSLSFDLLNIYLTLLYTSCTASALPLGIILTSNESEETLIFAFNLLNTILSNKEFYNRESEIGAYIFITDNSNAEWNALKYCFYISIEIELKTLFENMQQKYFIEYPNLVTYFIIPGIDIKIG
ncbi:33745_t:CDS:2, partial [Gigaspora margarita]